MSSTGGARRLLIRDLAQLATPRGTDAPLRGPALADVEVLEDAYVLCCDGYVEAIGRMRDLAALDGEVEELDARGLCAVPGSRSPGLITRMSLIAAPSTCRRSCIRRSHRWRRCVARDECALHGRR